MTVLDVIQTTCVPQVKSVEMRIMLRSPYLHIWYWRRAWARVLSKAQTGPLTCPKLAFEAGSFLNKNSVSMLSQLDSLAGKLSAGSGGVCCDRAFFQCYGQKGLT